MLVLGVLLRCMARVKSHLLFAWRVSGLPHPLSNPTAVAQPLFLCTLQDGSGTALNNLQQPVANMVFGIMCWVLLTANLCQIFSRVRRAHNLKKVWKRRRLVTCSLSILELIVQWVSHTSCSGFSGRFLAMLVGSLCSASVEPGAAEPCHPRLMGGCHLLQTSGDKSPLHGLHLT